MPLQKGLCKTDVGTKQKLRRKNINEWIELNCKEKTKHFAHDHTTIIKFL